ncbi:MAG: hypothetical protein ABII96_09320, partial [Candidatus Zixiibacteriota bacterium]
RESGSHSRAWSLPRTVGPEDGDRLSGDAGRKQLVMDLPPHWWSVSRVQEPGGHALRGRFLC